MLLKKDIHLVDKTHIALSQQNRSQFHHLRVFFKLIIGCFAKQVACMQFINIIVHSVEDMNYRVHLQYEFTKLGLDEYLERLRNTESEDLKVYIVGGPLTSKMLEPFFNTPVGTLCEL